MWCGVVWCGVSVVVWWLGCVLDVEVHERLHRGLSAFGVMEEEQERGIAAVGVTTELLDPSDGARVVDDVLWGQKQKPIDVVALCVWVEDA